MGCAGIGVRHILAWTQFITGIQVSREVNREGTVLKANGDTMDLLFCFIVHSVPVSPQLFFGCREQGSTVNPLDLGSLQLLEKLDEVVEAHAAL